jgi:anaerobic magnesium-protoporphyrin IX monomethyl ester cyclase
MRVALLSPYSEINAIGLRTISAYLKAHGIDTRLVFLPLQKSYYSRETFTSYPDAALENIIQLVRDDDLIGISVMSHYHDAAGQLTAALKRKLPDTPVVWGGIHPTVIPEKCIAVADFLCIGEGEIPLLALCRCLAEGKSAEGVPGIWSKKNGTVFRNRPARVITDLDTIPPQDYDLEREYILVAKKDLIPITPDNIRTFLGVTYWTMFTRGCPFSCTYCCNDALKRIHRDFARIRSKSSEAMMREITAITGRFPFIRYINFQDDTLFALSEEEIRQFAEHYKKNIDLPFLIPGVQPSVFTENKFEYLVNAGMLRARMGIQTGSKRILALYNRKQDNETVVRISEKLQKYAKKLTMPNYDLILDNPWETQSDILETITLLGKLAPPYSLNLFSLAFFPGTSLCARALAEHLIDENTGLDHYLNCKPTYLNLVIALFGLFKAPPWLLKLLLSKRLIGTTRTFPRLHRIIYNLILYRRGIYSLATRDYSMFPPWLQIFLCKVLPPRRVSAAAAAAAPGK